MENQNEVVVSPMLRLVDYSLVNILYEVLMVGAGA